MVYGRDYGSDLFHSICLSLVTKKLRGHSVPRILNREGMLATEWCVL